MGLRDGRPGGNQPPEPGPNNHLRAASTSRTAADGQITSTEVENQPAEWRPIPPPWDAYIVSRDGRIASLDRVVFDRNGRSKRLRGVQLRPFGHGWVHLSSRGHRRAASVRALVAATWPEVAA